MHGFEIILFLIGVDTFVFFKEAMYDYKSWLYQYIVALFLNQNKRNNKQRNIESGEEFIDGQNEIVKATDSYRNNYFVHRNSNDNIWSEFLQSSEQREYCDMYCIAVLLYVINNKLRVNCD